MIQRILAIDLENFQSHRNTHIDSDGGVVVLSGESNNGKSVVVRALQWLFTNRPTGDGFVSHWIKHENKKGDKVMDRDGQCSVTIRLVDTEGVEHTISRVKRATENWYTVDGTKLSAIGTDVPDEVQNILGIKEVNYQDQDEKYFLLSLTGSQVSAKLNELVHLDKIDAAYQITKRHKLDASGEYKTANKLYLENKVLVDGLKHIPTLASELDEVDEMWKELEESESLGMSAGELLDDISDVRERLTDMPDLDRMGDRLERVGELMSDVDELKNRRESIGDLLYDMDEYLEKVGQLKSIDQKDIDELEKMVSSYIGLLNESEGIGDILHDCECIESRMPADIDEKKMQNLVECMKESAQLKGICDSIGSRLEMLDSLTDEMAEVEDELKELREQLPEICPLCGQPMKEHMEHV